MATFRFRLQRLLDYRKLREEILKNDLASLDRAILAKEKDLASWHDLKNTYSQELNSKQASGVKGWEAHLYSLFLRRADGEISKRRAYIEKLRITRKERQKELHRASMDRKMMETLRSKAWEEFRHEAQRKEQKQMDEVAARGFLNRKTPERGAPLQPGELS